jgi:hypothetical protein
MTWKIIATVGLIAGASVPALAQAGPPPGMNTAPGGGLQAPPGSVNGAAARADRDEQASYNRAVGQGVKVTNADGKPVVVKKGPVAATAADITVGATVRDKAGVPFATVEKIDSDGVVVKTGDKLAKLGLQAFGKDEGGLLIGLTAADFQAAIAKTAIAAPQESQEPEVVAATAADIKPGAAVRDSEGVPVATVDKLVETGVILLMDGKKVKLAVDSFGKDDKGLLLGITASEFKAIISKSASAKSGG